MKPIAAALSLLTLPIAIPLAAQQPNQINLVAATVSGRVEVPPATNWKFSRIDLYDDGARPVVTFNDPTTHLTLSVILFPNHSGNPTPEGCRKDALDPLLQHLDTEAVLKDKTLDTRNTPAGATLATGSYLIANASKLTDTPIQQQNVFAFLGNAHTCAELHLSKVDYKPADLPLFNAALDQFIFDADYQPTSDDYAILAKTFYRTAQNFPAAAVYYQRALDTLPDTLPTTQPPTVPFRRYLTDQLSMSYAITGDIKRSREVNEQAIKIDPDYPLYYYNLACADAEQGNATDAHTHLKQAFDRKANTLPGEHLPDPTTDDSIKKLKKNKDFWAFVQTLSPQAKP
jgi:tetratricopeptide (TPR) repeat protein